MLVGKIVRTSVLACASLLVSIEGHQSRNNEFNCLDTNWKSLPGSEPALNTRDNFFKNLPDDVKRLIKFEQNKDETLNGKICRAYVPNNPEGKPLFVLILGHVEELNFLPEYSGIMHLFERLVKEDRGTVLLFRTGVVYDELETMLSPEVKKQLEPNTVFKQTRVIAREFIKGLKPGELRLAGFSWGGGEISELAKNDDWRQGLPVKRTVMIDPICYGTFGLGLALRTRPEFKDSPDHRNFHIYQRKDNVPLKDWLTTIQGNYPVRYIKDKEGRLKAIKDERPGDIIWHVPNTSHLDIDDIEEVRKKTYDFLVG